MCLFLQYQNKMTWNEFYIVDFRPAELLMFSFQLGGSRVADILSITE